MEDLVTPWGNKGNQKDIKKLLKCDPGWLRMKNYVIGFESLHTTIKLKLMKKNKKNIQMPVPDKSGVCATCFFKFHDRTSETGFYCIKNHEEVLANGNC